MLHSKVLQNAGLAKQEDIIVAQLASELSRANCAKKEKYRQVLAIANARTAFLGKYPYFLVARYAQNVFLASTTINLLNQLAKFARLKIYIITSLIVMMCIKTNLGNRAAKYVRQGEQLPGALGVLVIAHVLLVRIETKTTNVQIVHLVWNALETTLSKLLVHARKGAQLLL